MRSFDNNLNNSINNSINNNQSNNISINSGVVSFESNKGLNQSGLFMHSQCSKDSNDNRVLDINEYFKYNNSK